MSRPERRREREAEFEREYQARRKEEARKEALSMWGRIEEADTTPDVKDILHRLASHLGLES